MMSDVKHGLETVPRASRTVVLRYVAGECLLIPFAGNIAALDSLFVLDEVGRNVWERLDGERSFARLSADIAAVYDVATGQAEEDIKAFVTQLSAAGLVETPENA